MSSTIGDTLRLTLFGRSHGPVIGMTLAGIPAGKALSPAALQAFLDRRARCGHISHRRCNPRVPAGVRRKVTHNRRSGRRYFR